jgi:hypothetical protein
VVVKIPPGGKLLLSFSGPATVDLEAQYWNPSIADPRVLTFSPADGSGRWATEPLFTGVNEGDTTAVLTYSPPGAPPQRVTFDVTVAGR